MFNERPQVPGTMTSSRQESEDHLQQLHAAWQNALSQHGEGSAECIAALEKYSTFLLEMGERPAKSESAVKFILGQSTVNDGEPVTGSEQESSRLGSGTLINGKYEIIRWIGQGGISRVYLVKDLLHNKEMALKICHANLKSDKDTLEQFAREAKAGSLLNHPNLVSAQDSGVAENGCPFIVMEYFEGLTLSQLLARDKFLQPEQAILIFSQVCDALEHAHNKKIIHCDLKPNNIILIQDSGDSNFVKVFDFGFAVLSNEQIGADGSHPGEIDVFGSPHYMSPEQCQGARKDARSDIYSLACVMYEALSGAPPFEGSPSEIVKKQIHDHPARLDNQKVKNQQLLKKLELITFRCLGKEPDDRYQSMSALKSDLENLAQPKENQGLIKKLYRGFFQRKS